MYGGGRGGGAMLQFATIMSYIVVGQVMLQLHDTLYWALPLVELNDITTVGIPHWGICNAATRYAGNRGS